MSIAEAYAVAKHRLALGLDPPPRPPDPPDVIARDLVSWHKRQGRRAVLVTGDFDAVTPPEILAVLRQTTDLDGFVVAVKADPAGAMHDLDARMKLARAFRDFDYVMPLTGPAAELARRIGADIVVEIPGSAAPEAPR